MVKEAYISVVIFCGIFAVVSCQGALSHFKLINKNYKVSWGKLNKTHIGFQTEVLSTGWFGFGLSADGKMFPGDVVIGYVDKNNQAVFNDYHTTGYLPPELDDSQDWSLTSATVTNHRLVFGFVRPLNTHDNDDAMISRGNTHLIWAFSNTKPTSPTDFVYHGDNRGSVVIDLFRPTENLVGK